jgi:hypothetical protein
VRDGVVKDAGVGEASMAGVSRLKSHEGSISVRGDDINVVCEQ